MALTTYPTKAQIAAAAVILRNGGLVAFPTETVYGLGANALNATAVRKIFEVKGRPASSPLIVHVDSIEMARSMVVTEWPDRADRLARKFWPGPLSLVLAKRDCIPAEVTAGLMTVGVRSPSHPVAMDLIHEAAVPIAAPSANPFTHISPTTAQHVQKSFGSNIDLILDGGPTSVGIESTVLSLAGDQPLLLRPGMISHRELEEMIGPILIGGEVGRDQAHAAPGMHERHYSPSTPLLLTSDPPSGRGAYVWWNLEIKNSCRAIQLPADPAEYARELYSALHTLDQEGLDFIAVEPVPSTSDWNAIQDRLRRARNQK